ncbi:MAG: LysM peptidoglycan-binding domain-containing protein [Desulfuromonas sp.]|nr:LysM peptidoglycan-binding domain-containing protein [Desulfuromonas sp.]
MLTEYRVGSSDTLASIAALIGVYGDPMLWPLLYQANRDQIKDPQYIYVGQTLKIPRGLLASDFEAARQKAREAGLFGLPQNGAKPAPPR